MSSREVKKTEAGRDYQTELLTKEFSRLRKSLTKQISLFDGLINNTTESTEVKRELEKLNLNFTELNSVFNRLCSLVDEERVDLLNNIVVLEGKNVERINKAVEDWLGVRDRFDSLGQEESAQLSDQLNQLSLQHDPNISLTIDFMNKHSKLERQIGLTSELLMTRNISMIRKETKVLKQLYKETCEMSTAVQGQLSSKERKKFSH